MALDPKKRTPEELARLQAVANPLGDTMASQLGAKLQANRDAIARGTELLKTRPQIITADSGRVPESALKPLGSGSLASVAKPPVMIDPANPASMQLTPPSRADAFPARTPANPAPQAGASAPAGGGAAPRPGVTFNNGSGATFQTGDGRTGQLPAGVAVVRQKNGVNAFGATGASVAAASGVPAQSFGGSALAMPTIPQQTQPNLNVALPRPVSAGSPFALHEARDNNAALLSKLDSANFAASIAAPHSRGARALQGQILGQMTDLSNAGLRSASDIAGGDRDAANAVGLAGMNQQGENQRALLGDNGATNRAVLGEVGANSRAALASQTELSKPSTITDADGNLLSVVGGRAAPVLGADGKPVKPAQTKAEGAITPAVQLDALTKQLAAEAGALQPNQERIGALQQQISALTSGNGGSTQAPSGAPSLQDFMAKAKAANPNKSDAELQAYYTKTYGGK